MDLFTYKNRILHCEDVPMSALAENYGTPLYVYSQGTLLHHLRSLQTAFAAKEGATPGSPAQWRAQESTDSLCEQL